MKKSHILGTAALCALVLTGVSLASDHRSGQDRHHRGHQSLMMLGLADANDDNVVTRSEVDALQSAEFAFRDRNSDGFLDREDASPIRQLRYEARQERREARANAGEDRRDRPRRAMRGRGGGDMMRRLDTNDDQRVSQAEFLAGPDRVFERFDTNEDGSITAAEIEERISERRSNRMRNAWWQD